MKIDTGNTAWLLASSALVLLMTPGLAFFYGGMTRVKSVLNMIMMSFGAIGVVSVLWVLYGYTLSFSTDAFRGLIGNLDHLGMAKTLTAATLETFFGLRIHNLASAFSFQCCRTVNENGIRS